MNLGANWWRWRELNRACGPHPYGAHFVRLSAAPRPRMNSLRDCDSRSRNKQIGPRDGAHLFIGGGGENRGRAYSPLANPFWSHSCRQLHTYLHTSRLCWALRRNVFLMPKVELEADAAFITASASSARPHLESGRSSATIEGIGNFCR